MERRRGGRANIPDPTTIEIGCDSDTMGKWTLATGSPAPWDRMSLESVLVGGYTRSIDADDLKPISDN